MKRLLIVFVIAVISGCATVSKVERGEQVVDERMVVQLDGPWNKFEGMAALPRPTWTVEGVTVDQLQFFVGVKDGENLVPERSADKDRRPLTFKASMQPHQVVALFQAMLTADGSSFTLDKLDPEPFLGGQGYRFQFSLIRRVDEVRLSGLGYAVNRGGQLYAILYQAPRLAFYPRYEARIDKMARSARLRG